MAELKLEDSEVKGGWFSGYARKLRERKNLFLLWAFLIPMGMLLIIYFSLKVFPFGENSVLILDLNGQYVYFFEELRNKILGGGSLIYSWTRALGGEFLGIFAYYIASPFSLLVCLFPKANITEALLLIFALKAGSCGFTMALYLRSAYPTRKMNTIVFSTMYALCSYAVVQAHNTMWIDELIFLPLVVLGIERLIKKKDFVLFTVSLALCAMSNFYIGYMVCIFTFFYFFYYYFAKSGNGENNPTGEKKHFIKSLARIAVFSVIALEISMVVLYPAYISLSFGKTTFSDPSFAFTQKFDFLDFLTKLFPASYDTVRPEGLPFVYCGTLTLIMLPMFFLSKKIGAREKIGGGFIIAVFIFSFMSSTIDIVWHGFQKPNWLNYRYSFMLIFIMIVFAYRAFAEIKTLDYRHIIAVCGALVLLLVIIQKQDYEWFTDIRGVWLSMLFIALYLCVLYVVRRGWLKYGAIMLLAGVVVTELFVSSILDEHTMDDDVVFSSRTSYQSYMNKLTPIVDAIKSYDETHFDSAFYRMDKTSIRKNNDNMTLEMNGISNSSSTLNASVIKLLNDLGYASKSHWSKYLGGTAVNDSLLGLKYVILQEENAKSLYTEIDTAKDSTNSLYGYYNPYALSLCYGVNQAVKDIDFEDGTIIENPFERMNALVSAMLGTDTKLFKPVKSEMTKTNIDTAFTKETETAGRNIKYSPTNEGAAAKLTYALNGTGDSNELFCYFPSDFPRKTTIYLNGSKVGTYFEGETHRIVSLGYHADGEALTFDMQLEDKAAYLVESDYYFYYLDAEAFKSVMPLLQKNMLNITSFSDTHIKGNVTINGNNTLMFTSIPYDEGWNVKVDGRKVETVRTLDALLAFDISNGSHKVELDYWPTCLTYGLIVTVSGIVTFAAAIIIVKPESFMLITERIGRGKGGKGKKPVKSKRRV